jgi:hypothetical protein
VVSIGKRSGMKFIAEVSKRGKLLVYEDLIFVIRPNCPICELTADGLREINYVPPSLLAHVEYVL